MFKTLSRMFIAAFLFTGMVAAEVSAAIKSQSVTYMVGNEEFTGYLVYDDSKTNKRPGIIVIHEWWGHDAYARKRAQMLAQKGYTALALDMYGTGKLANHPKDAQSFMSEATKSLGIMKARLPPRIIF